MNNGFYNFPKTNQISAKSASYALTSSYVNPLNQSVQITGSLNVQGNITQNGVDLNSLMIAYSIALG